MITTIKSSIHYSLVLPTGPKKSHILFHENVSLRNFHIMTLIQVTCDLPEDKTYLGKETKFEATNCQTLRCYEGIMVYKSSKEQIEALMRTSVSCRQTIKLECISAPIQDLVSTALFVT